MIERSRTTRALHPTVDPTPTTVEEQWSDFRWSMVDGVLHPFAYNLVNVDTGEKLSWLEVHSITVNADLNTGFFRKPD